MGHDVHGNQYRRPASFEFTQDPITFMSDVKINMVQPELGNHRHSLFLVSMDSKHRPAILMQILCDLIRNALSANKDQDIGVLSTNLVKMLDQLGLLFKVTADLEDVVVRGEIHKADVDLDHVCK